MRAFFDTNVLVAAVTKDSDRSETATALLNRVDDGYTSVFNLMELRAVLAKKKGFERDRIERIEDRISGSTTVTSRTPPTSSPPTVCNPTDFSIRWTR